VRKQPVLCQRREPLAPRRAAAARARARCVRRRPRDHVAEHLRPALELSRAADAADAEPTHPPPRTKCTRRVPHPVLIGHAASLTPY
jgi:hypothetical protein